MFKVKSLWHSPRKFSLKKVPSTFIIEFIVERTSDGSFRTFKYIPMYIYHYHIYAFWINRLLGRVMLYKSRFCLNWALFPSYLYLLSLSLSFFIILSQSTYIYIHIYMDKEVHCTFRCVVVFSGWTCLVANSVKRWKAALTSSVIGKTLTRYSGLLWRCFRYLPKKRKEKEKEDTFSRIFSRAFLTSLYSVYYILLIYSCIYINVVLHRINIYIYTLSIHTYCHVFWFSDKLKSCDLSCVRLHFIWFLRPQVTYNWEISAFQHVVVIFSTGREGGKGRRRLPVPTLEVIETLNEVSYKCFLFFLWGRLFFKSSSVSFILYE